MGFYEETLEKLNKMNDDSFLRGKCKNYKDCEKIPMGYSDIAVLVLVGCREGQGAVTELLNFGSDGDYSAYIALEDTEIGEHYNKVTSFNSWLKIYDDADRIIMLYAQTINIYRAGDFGTIIQLIKPNYTTLNWLRNLYGK